MTSPALLAAFISPALFLGGSAAVAAPILIHLLARRRFKRIRWAAMEFLIDAERRNRRRIHLEEWILLALRCLAVFLLGLMVARPFFRPTGAAAFLGGAQRTERIFLLDDSLSMAYRSADRTSFSQAKAGVRRLLEAIRRDTPDDTVTILRMTAPTTPVESGTYLDDRQTDELLARLDALSPSQQAIDPARVIEGAAEVLSRSADITHAVIYVLSDFQRHDWTGRVPADGQPGADTANAGGTGILQPLVAWTNEDRGLNLVLVNVGAKDAANLAVTELSIKGGRLVAGASGTVVAKVSNHSDRSAQNLELQLSIGNLPQPSKTVRDLPPRLSASVDLEGSFLQPGIVAVRVELPHDALPADNVRYAAVDVASAVRILLVNGEPATNEHDDEVTFLTTALRPEGEVFSGNEVFVVDEAGFDETNLTPYHVVVLANVYRVSEPAVESLEHFVRRGGGLLVFLGDQVDADLYNTGLYRDGEGLLPAEVGEIIRAPDESHLVITDRLHPAMRGLSREGDPLGISQIPFFQYFACTPLQRAEENDEETPTSATGEAGSTTAVARVIARFDDLDENPAIIERSFGQGRVVLIVSGADKEWHHWPDHPTYLPVMMELVRHVARRSDTGTGTWVGESIRLQLDPATFEPDAIVRTPGYPNEREVGLTASPADDGQGLTLTWEHTETAGFYEFLLKRRDGGETRRLAAVNTDPRESDLTMAGEDDLRRSLRELPFEYFDGIDQLTGASGERRTELWKLVLLAAAAVLLMEQTLAWYWGRRS